MDILISAIVGDLVGRSASFLISKYFQQQPDINKIAQRLQCCIENRHRRRGGPGEEHHQSGYALSAQDVEARNVQRILCS